MSNDKRKNEQSKLDKIKKLYKKYEDIIAYLFFGVCTTVVNIVVYIACAKGLKLETVPSTIIAWVAAVAFAYITNRKWVFKSQNTTKKAIIREVISFVLARLATGLLDIAIMYVCVDLWHWSDIVMKIISNIIVIILNYVASKLFIFVKTENKKPKSKKRD